MDLKRLSFNRIFWHVVIKLTAKGKEVTMTNKMVEVELPLILVSLRVTGVVDY